MMEKLIKKLNNRKGFTLIELIVVIAIIGILAAILIPQFTGFQDKAKGTQALVDAKQIATALDGFYVEKGAWPASTSENAIVLATAFGDAAKAASHGAFTTNKDPDTLNNGGFEWTTNTTPAFKAGRTDQNSKVEMK